MSNTNAVMTINATQHRFLLAALSCYLAATAESDSTWSDVELYEIKEDADLIATNGDDNATVLTHEEGVELREYLELARLELHLPVDMLVGQPTAV